MKQSLPLRERGDSLSRVRESDWRAFTFFSPFTPPRPSRIVIRGPRCRVKVVEVYRRPAPQSPAHGPRTDAGPDAPADNRNERTGRSRAAAGESLSFGGIAPSTPALVGPTASLDASSARTVRGSDSSAGDYMHRAHTPPLQQCLRA